MNLQKVLYLASRTVGDAKAAKKGQLLPRVIKREARRTILGKAKRKGWWF